MMSQYDTEKFCQPPDPDLICCICQCVLLSPVECPCRHVFCNVCITTWLINHHNCPTCRRRVRQIQLKPVLPMVQNMINRLLMFCDFRDNGCAENVMLELYLGHVEKCGYRKIKCCFSRCGQMILLKDKEQHENKDCDFREKLCTGRCGLMIPVCMFDSHDCCEELRRFNREKSEMVTELKQKVKELNDMTKKLQKEVDRLREQLQRRRWPMPFGDSWDSDSMYNFLTGSSYSDDQDSDTSSRDFRSSRDNNNPPPTTSTENGALVQFVVYSRPSTPPVSQTTWPTYQTRSTNYGYDILPPTPPRHSNSTSGPNQALDLSYPAPPVNTLIPLPGISEENNNNRQSNVSAWGIPTTNYQPRGTNLPINDGRQENEQINTESHAESYNNEPNGVVNLNTSIPVVNMEEVIHDRNHHSIDETNRHSDHTVYSLSDSDSERRHSRWWRSNWSSVSHLSEHQSDNENRSRSSRSRSNSRESYRSIVRQGRYLRFYSHTSRSRSRSVYSDTSGNRSHSYDSYRRSRSYNSYRSRSGSSDYVRSRSRSYDYSRSRSRSYDYSRSRSRSYYGRSRSRSYDYDRSGSRSSNTERSTSSSRSSISLCSNSRSLSRSMSRSSNNSTRSRSLSSVYSDVSGSLSTVCSNRNSRSRSRSTTPHSNWSETPTHSRSDIRTSNSSLAPSRSPEKTCFSSNMVNQENNPEGEIAGTSVLPNIGTDIDSTETDSDAGYDFKRRKSKVDNSSNNSDSGIGTELSPTNGDQMNVQNKMEDKSLNSGVQRKRKNSGSDYDRESKRVCVGENLEHCDNTDSNASWVPTDHENEENDTISDEASSESSYEVCVPKTIMEHIDEYDSNETDDTWSPN